MDILQPARYANHNTGNKFRIYQTEKWKSLRGKRSRKQLLTPVCSIFFYKNNLNLDFRFSKDVFVGIVSFLDFTTLTSIPLVCKEWAKWLQDESIWKHTSLHRHPSLHLLSTDALTSTVSVISLEID